MTNEDNKENHVVLVMMSLRASQQQNIKSIMIFSCITLCSYFSKKTLKTHTVYLEKCFSQKTFHCVQSVDKGCVR